MKKRIIILGSTGSVGLSTLDVLSRMTDEWDIVGLAAGTGCDEFAQQANRLRPGTLAVADADRAQALKSSLTYAPTVFGGDNALADLVEDTDADCVVSAVVGIGGLSATIRALQLGKRVALASKEALVIAGSLLMPLVENSPAEIIPVDSEHSAVFQALHSGRPGDVEKVYLTASGGPFRTWTTEQMEQATLEEALKHPTWNMGPKITIDSATMMNKALEIIEARWLFDLRPDQIAVIIHCESIIHSMVEFRDGSMIAQLSAPDMRTPIQYALTYPQRHPCPAPRLDLSTISQLSFEPPDTDRFPALQLGHDVASRGGTSGAVLNAANEAAVELFRKGLIGLRDIARHTARVLEQHDFLSSPTLDELLAADRWAREEVNRCTTC